MKLAIVFSTILATSTTTVASTSSLPWITMSGFGHARIGMTVPELERALGRKIDPPKDEEEVRCRYVEPEEIFEGVSFMLLQGRLARIDINSQSIRTLSGARVGDSQASVLSLYGRKLTVSPHKYAAPEGSYLTMFSRDSKYGIRFETDGPNVSGYYVGTAEAVQYVEGCQ